MRENEQLLAVGDDLRMGQNAVSYGFPKRFAFILKSALSPYLRYHREFFEVRFVIGPVGEPRDVR